MNFEKFKALKALPLLTNSLVDWVLAAAVVAGSLLVLLGARRLVRRTYAGMQKTEQSELFEPLFEILSRSTALSLVVLSLYLGLRTLTMSDGATKILNTVVTVVLFWQAGVWATAATTVWLEHKRRHRGVVDHAAVGSLTVIRFVARVTIWVMVVLLTLGNLGVNVTALVAGLGVGGIAVALAVQNVLGDLLASLSITLDRPFVHGDFLAVDDYLGSVENVGIKTTRLRSLGGEQLILANADLVKSRVRNYGRMTERRVVFAIGVTYQTPADSLERIPKLIEAAITSQEQTRFERSHFQKFGDSSLDFETVYYMISPDFNRYMDVQQAINLRIFREFQELGIEFAYPTRTLFHAGSEETGAVAKRAEGGMEGQGPP